MPTYPHIDHYREELQRLLDFGGSDNESSIRRAFAVCLDSYCREHKERLALVDELAYKGLVYPDGTVKDSLRMARGYWEAKDTHDDLDAEIQNKFNKGVSEGQYHLRGLAGGGADSGRGCGDAGGYEPPRRVALADTAIPRL